jgi:hypothetical protein
VASKKGQAVNRAFRRLSKAIDKLGDASAEVEAAFQDLWEAEAENPEGAE